jgi:hypothetical protein
MILRQPNRNTQVECDECFFVLEYLAQSAIDGMEETQLREAVLGHINQCPDCREHHLKRLSELESHTGDS